MSTLIEFSNALYDFHKEKNFKELDKLCKSVRKFYLKKFDEIDKEEFDAVRTHNTQTGLERKETVRKELNRFMTSTRKLLKGRSIEDALNFYHSLFDENNRLKYNGCTVVVKRNTSFYRIRSTKQTYEMFDKGGLYAIPDNKRQLIGPNRFNAAGYSSLYLASNLYLCWEECRRPNFEDMNFSRFENVEELRLLDLTIHRRPIEIGHFIMAYLTLLCSVKANDDDKYKFQYVVPEWMMTLLLHHQAKMKHKEHCLMGIRYLSSRRYDCEDFCFTDKNLSIAYVFPVTGVGGQAKRIEDSFRMTAPRSYFFYKIHRFDFGKRRARISDYDDSLFFQIEQQLKKEKLEEIRE